MAEHEDDAKVSDHDSDVVSYFCRHLISILISYQAQTNRSTRDKFQAYTGYVIEIEGHYLFISAGHVIKNIVDAIRNKDIDIRSVNIGDVFGINKISNIPIPTDLRGASYFYIDDTDEHLDFGYIEIDKYYVDLMKKNGIEIPNLSHCRSDREAGYSGFLMLGLPEEGSSRELDASGNAMVTPTLVAVEKIDMPDEHKERDHQFIGRIPKLGNLESLVGMSGGPIFGLQMVNGQYKYWLVATQSSWEKNSRTVYAMPILPVMKYLQDIGYNPDQFDKI